MYFVFHFIYLFYFSLSFYWALGPHLFWDLFWAQVLGQFLKHQIRPTVAGPAFGLFLFWNAPPQLALSVWLSFITRAPQLGFLLPFPTWWFESITTLLQSHLLQRPWNGFFFTPHANQHHPIALSHCQQLQSSSTTPHARQQSAHDLLPSLDLQKLTWMCSRRLLLQLVTFSSQQFDPVTHQPTCTNASPHATWLLGTNSLPFRHEPMRDHTPSYLLC